MRGAYIINNNRVPMFLRIFIGLVCPVLVAAGTAYLYIHGNPFICIFNSLVGLYCTGCGSGRAAYDLIHGNIIEALDHNFLMIMFLPFIIYYLFKRYITIVINRDLLPSVYISHKMFVSIIIIIIIIFTIVRNIPIYPFSLLAP